MSSIFSPSGWGRAAWTAIRGARGTNGWGHHVVSVNFSMPKTDAQPWDADNDVVMFPIFCLPPSDVVGRWCLEAASFVTDCENGENTPITGTGNAANGTRMWLQLSENGNMASAGEAGGTSSKQLSDPFVNTAHGTTDPIVPLRVVTEIDLESGGNPAENYFSDAGNTIIGLAVQRAGTGDDMPSKAYVANSGLTMCITLFFRVQPPQR